MGLLSLVCLVCALRTNVAFIIIFAGLLVGFGLLTGVYWHLALGHAALAAKLEIVSHLSCIVEGDSTPPDCELMVNLFPRLVEQHYSWHV